jgi:hypothetical protein
MKRSLTLKKLKESTLRARRSALPQVHGFLRHDFDSSPPCETMAYSKDHRSRDTVLDQTLYHPGTT